MKDTSDCLVIGNTSQISNCLPDNFHKVSSRNFDCNLVGDYEKIFICFAEQRTFDNSLDFLKINYDYTLQIIDSLLPKCNKLIFYSTAMLWENLETYSIEDSFSYNEDNNYLVSKQKVTDVLKTMNDVLIHYPCNFNSTYRKSGYLFSKLVDACRGKVVKTGNLDFNRELVHTTYVANKSLNSNTSEIIASGYLTNVRKYFHDVLDCFGLPAENIQESIVEHKSKRNSIHSIVDMVYNYDKLLRDTVTDIRRCISD